MARNSARAPKRSKPGGDWSGRFDSRLDPHALAFSTSLPIDRRLSEEDIAGSIAHVSMLAHQRIISSKEARRIRLALNQIRKEIASGRFNLEDPKHGGRFVAEDVHMAIEQRLMEKVGAIGGKLHTARSRNDQIALDERLFLRTAVKTVVGGIARLQKACLQQAERNADVLMPGYTHLQRAQPILLSHHLLAYVEMLQRDRERFLDCLKRIVMSPLGAGALAGTSFPIDRRRVARDLRLGGIVQNSIDAVSDRDVQIEFIATCAITMMHLSRFAEELVLWSSEEWHFAEIGEAFTTGSSIMPQKKNPDMAELVRGKTGRVYGDLMALLTVMKGLPLAYNRDMQEDKEPLFDSFDTVSNSLTIFARMLAGVRFDATRFEDDASSDMLLATELADYLVRKGIPFRKAHAIVGGIVRACLKKGCTLKELPLSVYRRASDSFGGDLWKILDLRASVHRKRSEGSTSPKEVRKAIASWKKKLRGR